MNSKLFFPGIVSLALLFGSFASMAQSITGFEPKFGPVGTSVKITGSGFYSGVTGVKFFDNKSATFGATSDTQINAFVPAGATTGPITVIKGQNQASTFEDFIVIGTGPYITDFSPISGAGGTVVTLNGVQFGTGTTVKFNGIAGTTVQHTSLTTMKVQTPPNVTTGPITISRPGHPSFTTSSNFFAPAAITNFAPSKAVPGTTIVIKGKNFIGTTTVRFNGVVAPDFLVDSNTQITVTVPPNATTGLININPPGGQANSSSNFVVLPLITGFNPPIGNVGTNVTITGLNLLGNPQVKFDNSANASLSSVTSTQIVAVVPATATSGYITITTTNGVATSPTLFYLPPFISGFTPGSGSAGTFVTLTGKNFTNASDVAFNGVSANFGVVNNTTITSTIPIDAMSGPITVTTPGGTAVSEQNFFIKPSVTGFTPEHGIPGTVVTITGSSFTNVTAVRFNGADAIFSAVSNTELTATVPTNATTGPISVLAPGGIGTSAASFVVDTLALKIELLTNNVASISWPQSATGFNLEFSTNLSLTNWTLVTNATFVTNGWTTFTNAVTNDATFYRLRK